MAAFLKHPDRRGALFGSNSAASTSAEQQRQSGGPSIESRKLSFSLLKLSKMAEDNTYESMLCVKPEVHVYRIPPRSSNRGYRAADWKLDEPAWSGRLKITAKGKKAFIKLEDRNTGELYAQAPVEQYPGNAVEAVTDSSRYFVIRIEDGTGRHAFIGLGFADRGDSFDFNVALQDHFKWVKQEGDLAKLEASQSSAPKLDLSFKEGQTIKISIGNIKKKDAGGAKPRPLGGGLLPPPPGGKASGSGVLPPPGGLQTLPPAQPSTAPLLDLGSPVAAAQPGSDMWGDFTSAGSNSNQDAGKSGWVQFS
ncbi:adaptin ear-binding coat-associated protein 2 [Poecilia formosa]|uniref:NECAP endocytosis associated 2 n=1 Tax=Poecilia formosa TaxID=48698 RepID=A0A087YJD5_POEFO|nr:PREDICTED: adaptin ear-binding coat-associated protein 2 [Poecilia formosa]